MVKILGAVVAVVLFFGCSQPRLKTLDLDDSRVEELQTLPQTPSVYLQNYQDALELKEAQKHYNEKFYRIWRKAPKATKEEVMWPHRTYTAKKNLYGVNLKHLDDSFYAKMRKQADFESYMKLSKKALSVRGTNMRAFPTEEMVLKDPRIAGEGFPFDYLQNSYIAANKPLFVSHFSKNKEWVFAFSSFTTGWIKARDIVFIDDSDAKTLQNAKHVFVLKENKAVYDEKKNFLFYLRIGNYLPVIDENETSYTLLGVTKNGIDTPIYTKITLQKGDVAPTPLTFTKNNIEKILSQLQKTRYGWGGMFALRDCSATMRDYFAPFGVWIGRNSSVQAKAGRVVSLEGLDEDEKREKIEKEGIAFETLIYRKGHIALYVGKYNGKVIIFQNLWGIKTKQGSATGRVVIGRTVFSTLDLGSHLPNYDKTSSFAHKAKSFNIVTEME